MHDYDEVLYTAAEVHERNCLMGFHSTQICKVYQSFGGK
jgi:hypothetical protein